LRGALTGLLLVAACAAVAGVTGQERGFFLIPALIPYVVVAVCVASVLAGRPLTGMILNPGLRRPGPLARHRPAAPGIRGLDSGVRRCQRAERRRADRVLSGQPARGSRGGPCRHRPGVRRDRRGDGGVRPPGRARPVTRRPRSAAARVTCWSPSASGRDGFGRDQACVLAFHRLDPAGVPVLLQEGRHWIGEDLLRTTLHAIEDGPGHGLR
jgi:hypothetical protein